MNLTRAKNRFLRKESRFFATKLTFDELQTSAEASQVVVLPPDVLVMAAYLVIVTPFAGMTTATLDVGHTGAAAAFINDVDLESAAGTILTGGASTVVQKILPTGGAIVVTPVYTGGVPTEGEVLLVVEYLEYERVNGEQNNFLNT